VKISICKSEGEKEDRVLLWVQGVPDRPGQKNNRAASVGGTLWDRIEKQKIGKRNRHLEWPTLELRQKYEEAPTLSRGSTKKQKKEGKRG